MKENKIENLYDKFNENGVTTEVIWKLDDEILKDELKLTKLEMLKYRTAKSKNIWANDDIDSVWKE